MLCFKLSRVGKKSQPFFRIIVLEKAKDPFGDYLELLGNYNPKTKEINLKKDRIEYWLSKGAQATSTVHNLFVKEGIIKDEKRKSVKITKKRAEKIKGKKEKGIAGVEAPDGKEEKPEISDEDQKKTTGLPLVKPRDEKSQDKIEIEKTEEKKDDKKNPEEKTDNQEQKE